MFEWEMLALGHPKGSDYKTALWGRYNGRLYRINTSPTKVPDDYPITPAHLERPTGGEPVGNFGKFEIEILAAAIIKLAQKKGDWGDFTWDELIQFSRASGYTYDFSFILGTGWLIENASGAYSITIGFVNEIFEKQIYEERLVELHRRG